MSQHEGLRISVNDSPALTERRVGISDAVCRGQENMRWVDPLKSRPSGLKLGPERKRVVADGFVWIALLVSSVCRYLHVRIESPQRVASRIKIHEQLPGDSLRP